MTLADIHRTIDALWRIESARIIAALTRITRDVGISEELAQDVFLQLHATLPSLKSEGHVKFWLRKVTAHRCIDHQRRRKLPQVSLEDAPEPFAPAHAEDLLLAKRLQQLVASLPEKPKLVVILRFQEDMLPADIAAVLSMPVATVKSHLQRSLAVLRDKVTRTIGEVTL